MTRDISIQTTKDTEVFWRPHDPAQDLTADHSDWLRFGADQSIGSKSIELETDERAEYGSRDVEGREMVNVSPSLSLTATATHWWHLQAWLTGFEAASNETWDFTTDGAQDPALIDITVANTASGEDYVFGPCSTDVTVSLSDPETGGGDGNVDLSFEFGISNFAKVTDWSQGDDRTVTTFDAANPMYFKGALIDYSDWGLNTDLVLSEFEFSVTNNHSAIGQIPVTNSNGDVIGGIDDVTRSPGSRDFEITAGTLRIADETDESLDRALATDGTPAGDGVTTPDLTVLIKSGIRDQSGSFAASNVHEIALDFVDLFPTTHEYSGYDERGGDIQLDVSDEPTTMSARYHAQGATNPL